MEWLEKLCNELKIDYQSLKKDEENLTLVPLNQMLTIGFKPLDPGVFMRALIIPCPEQFREELFMLLMKANFLGRGTLGAVIALSPDEKNLTLSSAFPYDMNYRAFKEAVEDFANIADYWKEEIKRQQKEATQRIL